MVTSMVTSMVDRPDRFTGFTRSRQTVAFCSTVFSTSAYLLPQLKTKLSERTFSHAGLSAWNALPTLVCNVANSDSFRKLSKTHFF